MTADSQGLSALQVVLVELAALHDRREMSALVLQQVQIVQRVALDHQKIGQRAGCDNAQLAGPIQQRRVGCGCGGDDLVGRQGLGADRELERLELVQPARKIGAEAQGDSGRLA